METKPSCYLCDKPATHTRNGVRLCSDCNALAAAKEDGTEAAYMEKYFPAVKP